MYLATRNAQPVHASSQAPPPILHAEPSARELIFRLIHCVENTLTCSYLFFFFCYRAQSSNLSQYIAYIHNNYLKRICEESRFQGLKYHGGPISKCLCKEGVLRFVSFTMKNDDDQIVSDEVSVPKIDMKCEECLMQQNVNKLLQSQVSSLPWVLSKITVTGYHPVSYLQVKSGGGIDYLDSQIQSVSILERVQCWNVDYKLPFFLQPSVSTSRGMW